MRAAAIIGIDESVSVSATSAIRRDPISRDRTRSYSQDGLRDRIEVGDVVVQLRVRGSVLPAQADVQSEIRQHVPVILCIQTLHGLGEVRYIVIGQRVSIRVSEEKVTPVRCR